MKQNKQFLIGHFFRQGFQTSALEFGQSYSLRTRNTVLRFEGASFWGVADIVRICPRPPNSF